ncbi:hypothetical protein PHET_01752 [Paragonimus heterotremus]|uniref:Ensconsin n=1 Tax=Paragonimus heterotremus TaxID=100268 RepID=A0A8J4T568_9TREM|nr:hypothetical protein PHET_01752 [Paragonimus heterotremus]
MSSGDCSESNQPASASGSHSLHATSTAPSVVGLSLEERLKRMRAAEELRQQQRYAAYIESQRQAELARVKAQEDRRRKLEEMHERAEARRRCVIERRKELEMSTKARIELLLDRSRNRDTMDHPAPHRRFNQNLGRTASASPSLGGSTRNPNQLMTTSCVVAFGSSASRSICTQLSPAALRLQQAFEARLASYLTGRHSGCFLTPAAAPHYTHLLVSSERHCMSASTNPSVVAFTAHRLKQKRTLYGRGKRSVSAHASLMRPTKASLARSNYVRVSSKPTEDTSCTTANLEAVPRLNGRPVKKATFETGMHLSPEDEVTTNRSNSSQECNKLGRPPRVPSSSVSSSLPAKHTAPSKSVPSAPNSTVNSCTSSLIGSSRSNSVDTLAKRSNSVSHGPSVFDRLSARAPSSRSRTDKTDWGKTATQSTASAASTTKKSSDSAPIAKRPLGPTARTLPKGMSISVYADRTTDRKPLLATNRSVASRKRSASPKPSQNPEPLDAVPDHHDDNAPATVVEPPPALIDQDKVAITPPPAVITESSTPPPSPTVTATPRLAEGTVDRTEKEAHPTVSTEDSSSVGQPTISVAHSGPLKAETRGAGEGALLNESEAAIYRAKLIEQRRLAKERKEEEQRRLEEERALRQLQEEAARLAAERAAEQEAELAAQQAIEEQRQKEEEEKARLRMAETERLLKLQRAEEERVLRKKRLDSIMSRVKQAGTNGKSSSASSPPSGSVSTPLLLGQDEAQHSYNIPKGDISDSRLLSQAVTEPETPVPTGAASMNAISQSNELCAMDQSTVDRTGDLTPPFTSPRHISPVSFTLCSDASEVPAEQHTEESSVSWKSAEANEVKDEHKIENGFTPDTVPCNSELKSTSVPVSPSKTMLNHDQGSRDLESSANEPSGAPRFKSALLQSMLGGGRLTARAKDAVAGLRSRGSASHLSDAHSNGHGSGAQSPPHLTQPSASGDAPCDSDRPVDVPESPPADTLRSLSLVQSMFEVPVDRYHANGSSGPMQQHEPTEEFLNLAKVEPSYAAADLQKSVGSSPVRKQSLLFPLRPPLIKQHKPCLVTFSHPFAPGQLLVLR